jgi:hypothetical protein
MRCPKCDHKLLQKADDGKTKVRIRGPVTFSKAGLQSQCFWCHEEVVLPARLEAADAAPSEPRFVVRSK